MTGLGIGYLQTSTAVLRGSIENQKVFRALEAAQAPRHAYSVRTTQGNNIRVKEREKVITEFHSLSLDHPFIHPFSFLFN